MLRPRDVPLSVRAHPRRPFAQLHHGRRLRTLQARQGLQRAAPDGLGRLRHAGRECRHGAQGASGGVDLPEHRHHAPAAQVDGPVARLVARVRHLLAGLLPAPAEAVPRHAEEGARLPQVLEGQLGSGRSYRARQRAGDRRARLALGRAGRAARADAVVLQDHRLRRRAAGGAADARQVAGEGAPDAGELDRPLRGHAGPLRARQEDGAQGRDRGRGLHDASRHVVRRRVRGARA